MRLFKRYCDVKLLTTSDSLIINCLKKDLIAEFLFQATAHLKQAFKDPAIIPTLCAVMTRSTNPQVGSRGQLSCLLLLSLAPNARMRSNHVDYSSLFRFDSQQW